MSRTIGAMLATNCTCMMLSLHRRSLRRHVLLELREYFLPEQLYVLHDALVREVPVLHAAHHLIDAQVGIALHLLEALLGIANDEHVGIVERLDRDLAFERPLEQRELRVALLLG